MRNDKVAAKFIWKDDQGNWSIFTRDDGHNEETAIQGQDK